MKTYFLFASILAVFATGVTGFSGMSGTEAKAPKQIQTTTNTMSRSTFVAGAVGALFMPTIASAKGLEDADFAGMKSKGNEKVCFDRCLYDCTKNGTPKAQCADACKEECKDAKGQLIYGTPDVEKGSESKQ